MIFIIGRIFPTYRKAILDGLSQKVELKFLHGRNNSGIGQIVAPYSIIVKQFMYGKNETNVFLNPFYCILKYKPAVVIHELAIGIISLPLTFLLCKILGLKFALWGHAYDRKRKFSPDSSFKDKIRLFYLQKADAIIAYSKLEKQFLARIVDDKKIFVAQNTLDIPYLSKIKVQLEAEGKAEIKKRLNIIQQYNLIFIGRLLESKHPEILVTLYEKLTNKLNGKLGIHFVGQGEKLDALKKEISEKGYDEDFYFHGSIHDDEKSGELLYLCDMMVMPGYLGLSVNHAFCFECPVVSFQQGPNGPFHSPEVEYVENGKTGFLVETDNIEMMTTQIFNYLTDESLQEEIKRNIHHMITHVCSIENMEIGFMECFKYLNLGLLKK